MAIRKLVSTPSQAYSNIRSRLISDVGPVWDVINSKQYSPFWLLARSMMPIAESVGDLIYGDSSSKNLEKLIDNDLSKIRKIYAGKGKVIAQLYRHSFIHQDEPRSIYAGNITIHWNVAFMDGRLHLTTEEKDPRTRSCVMAFDLRTFYQDLIALLELYEKKGPRRGVVVRYNGWTFLNLNTADLSAANKKEIVSAVREVYQQDIIKTTA